MRFGFRFLALALITMGLRVASARADSYEWQRTQRALKAQGLELAEVPEGKRIAWIRLAREDVFVKDEVWPLVWANWFHGLTREKVIRRELLFADGEPYRDVLVEETMRNLRNMGIFTLVRIVAVKTENPDEVGILVYTRDLWSLRLETDFNVTRVHTSSFLLRATESNFAGRNKNVAMDFSLLPKTYSFGESYYARRVMLSRVSVTQGGGIIFNRASKRAEGSYFSGSVGEPFYRLAQRYQYLLNGGYTNQMIRSLSGGNPTIYQPDYPNGPSAYRIFRQKNAYASLMGYLRYGHSYKATFAAGWDYRQVSANPTAETKLPAELEADFARHVMPKQRREIGPIMSYEFWLPKFVTFTNLATYGQSENVRVGPSVAASVRAPLSSLGSSTNSWVVATTLGLVLAPRGGLIETRVTASTRYEDNLLVDQHATALLRGASPIFSIFRFVGSVNLDVRRRDTAKTFVTLGSDDGLRGYPTQSFYGFGADKLLCNFELRTLPVQWQALQVGGVIFYDTGSVFQDVRQIRMQHAVGIGLRFLIPQFNRYPLSLDAGMPLDPSFRFRPAPTFESAQVVPITANEGY